VSAFLTSWQHLARRNCAILCAFESCVLVCSNSCATFAVKLCCGSACVERQSAWSSGRRHGASAFYTTQLDLSFVRHVVHLKHNDMAHGFAAIFAYAKPTTKLTSYPTDMPSPKAPTTTPTQRHLVSHFSITPTPPSSPNPLVRVL
jgi:hypothetical protein